MRKPVSLLLALMMLLAAVCTAVPALAMGTRTYYVACSNGGDLNLRESPSKNAKSLAKIPYGTELVLYSLSDDKAWGYTTYKEKDGWVMMSFLSETAPDPANSKAEKALDNMESMNAEFRAMSKNPVADPYQVVVRTNKTTTLYHLRWAPYLSAFSMRSDVKNGEVFTVTAEGKSWYQVTDESIGLSGYIVKSICQVWSDPEKK